MSRKPAKVSTAVFNMHYDKISSSRVCYETPCNYRFLKDWNNPMSVCMCVCLMHSLPEGPKNLTQNSFSPPMMVTSCLLSILHNRREGGGGGGRGEGGEGEEREEGREEVKGGEKGEGEGKGKRERGGRMEGVVTLQSIKKTVCCRSKCLHTLGIYFLCTKAVRTNLGTCVC